MKAKKTIKYIDLFAGLGGIRLGFKQACEAAGYDTNCVLTAEIKTAAVKALTTNFGVHTIHGDVTTIDSSEIPNFDFLLAGFPCQAFSVAGKQHNPLMNKLINDMRSGHGMAILERRTNTAAQIRTRINAGEIFAILPAASSLPKLQLIIKIAFTF